MIKIPRGFTLLELMVVVLIMGILATLALPRYYRSIERSRMTEAYTQLAAIREAQLAYFTRYQTYTNIIANLQVDNPDNSPEAIRYFHNYTIPPSVPLTQGFTASCVRNDNSNLYSFYYSVTMNQDGQIDTDFYSGP